MNAKAMQRFLVAAALTLAKMGKKSVTKAIAVLLLLAMAVHIIKPLGLPGLKRRADFWKIAIFAFAIWTVALVINEVF
ncbi:MULTISPECIES: hypothetical protein [Rhizobium]|uniref:Uncharacterized protein n=1 Tax=Rhizobium tropici TaxID=398 RepID=A0A329Y720_RHITR|nr:MULTISPECIES: hypothetical protein [Rhizobium]MBB3290009.1 hypothetical protein [Rhizobium sp. BK252]MBB3404791.1 hypothetical protein [Rhizobium sp. BK289]MBB3417331.1 hypothetical protein [Rhizobium sp. BK284]MBB3485366.1 hypothetical protein [Rhizobium sp. BK347]MDK4722509.1 hypothetical protein [Rhizobium sp. CNPSo 3968]